jgi:hypothetical protein
MLQVCIMILFLHVYLYFNFNNVLLNIRILKYINLKILQFNTFCIYKMTKFNIH